MLHTVFYFTFIIKINYLFENVSKDGIFLHSVGYMAQYIFQLYTALKNQTLHVLTAAHTAYAYQFKQVL
jgi:hypothetical protein